MSGRASDEDAKQNREGSQFPLRRSLIFDLLVLVAAAILARNTDGWVQELAVFLAAVAILWIPFDIVQNVLARRRQGRPLDS